MSNLIDTERNFNFRLYSCTPRVVTSNLLFVESSEEISLVPPEDVPVGAYFVLAVITPTRLPSKLESGESIMSYSASRSFNGLGMIRGQYGLLGPPA